MIFWGVLIIGNHPKLFKKGEKNPKKKSSDFFKIKILLGNSYVRIPKKKFFWKIPIFCQNFLENSWFLIYYQQLSTNDYIFSNPFILRYFLAYVTYQLLEVVKVLFCVVKRQKISNNLVVLHPQCSNESCFKLITHLIIYKYIV